MLTVLLVAYLVAVFASCFVLGFTLKEASQFKRQLLLGLSLFAMGEHLLRIVGIINGWHLSPVLSGAGALSAFVVLAWGVWAAERAYELIIAGVLALCVVGVGAFDTGLVR